MAAKSVITVRVKVRWWLPYYFRLLQFMHWVGITPCRQALELTVEKHIFYGVRGRPLKSVLGETF